jgi:hypothetical protein
VGVTGGVRGRAAPRMCEAPSMVDQMRELARESEELTLAALLGASRREPGRSVVCSCKIIDPKSWG